MQKESVPVFIDTETYSDATKRHSLEQLIRQHCPSLFTPFEPPWWLNNGHLQTTYTALAGGKSVPKIQYMRYNIVSFSSDGSENYYFHTYNDFIPNRKLIRLEDGGTLALDLFPQDPSAFPLSTPILVILTGLTGSSNEGYVRVILSKLHTHRAIIINYRGCGGIPLTSPRLYTCGNTDDIRTALAYISNMYPHAPLHGLGFSLGAGIMTRYVAEEGEKSRLRSICCLACPWNMAANNRSLLSTYVGRKVYAPALGANFREMVKQNMEVFQSSSPEIHKAAREVVAIRRITLGQFDDIFTRRVRAYGPQFPFLALDELYEWGSSDHVLSTVRVPALYINADDDPIVSRLPKDGGGSPNVFLHVTSGGGHLGWHTPGYSYLNGFSTRQWTTEPVLEWLKLMATTEVETENGFTPSTIVAGPNGIYHEVDRPDVFWQELDQAKLLMVPTAKQSGTIRGF
ncbi:Alpha/Beta hydrolase protein [Collybia nuda]|uniref:Alpha/Beta hydrolase protein n=1 Tax=Collybia nuda TaxID=64659 RepID=A0A9P6CD05_9AGAR|nr:Alpha/Beta hydrolase protein [Collybia nuda]